MMPLLPLLFDYLWFVIALLTLEEKTPIFRSDYLCNLLEQYTTTIYPLTRSRPCVSLDLGRQSRLRQCSGPRCWQISLWMTLTEHPKETLWCHHLNGLWLRTTISGQREWSNQLWSPETSQERQNRPWVTTYGHAACFACCFVAWFSYFGHSIVFLLSVPPLSIRARWSGLPAPIGISIWEDHEGIDRATSGGRGMSRFFLCQHGLLVFPLFGVD